MKPIKAIRTLVQVFDPDCEDPDAYLDGRRDVVELICQKIVDAAEGEVYCPFCGKDLRTRYDCKSCDIDHRGECLRDGKHADDCLVLRAKGALGCVDDVLGMGHHARMVRKEMAAESLNMEAR